MKYNKLVLSTLFYVYVWRHIVRAYSSVLIRVSHTDGILANVVISRLLRDKPTPPQLDTWYRKNRFEYIPERIDNIKSAEAFVRDLGGDCDDFAEFAYMVLSASGSRCYRLFLSGSAPSHVVTVAYYGKRYFILDTYACYEVATLEEAVTYFVEDGLTNYLLL